MTSRLKIVKNTKKPNTTLIKMLDFKLFSLDYLLIYSSIINSSIQSNINTWNILNAKNVITFSLKVLDQQNQTNPKIPQPRMDKAP